MYFPHWLAHLEYRHIGPHVILCVVILGMALRTRYALRPVAPQSPTYTYGRLY